MGILVEHIKKHMDLSLKMLGDLIDICPEELWNNRVSGFIFWQQIHHALTGLLFWVRNEPGEFKEPFSGLRPPEHRVADKDQPVMGKEEIKKLFNQAEVQTTALFDQKRDDWLRKKNVIYNKILNIDMIEMQIRHIQYHVGHCDAALRERDFDPSRWYDYPISE